jgi:hypothetical protein
MLAVVLEDHAPSSSALCGSNLDIETRVLHPEHGPQMALNLQQNIRQPVPRKPSFPPEVAVAIGRRSAIG